MTGTKDVAAGRSFLDQLAVDHRENGRARMLVLPGLGTGIPAVVAHLKVCWPWNIGHAMLQQNLHAHLWARLGKGETRWDAGGAAQEEQTAP